MSAILHQHPACNGMIYGSYHAIVCPFQSDESNMEIWCSIHDQERFGPSKLIATLMDDPGKRYLVHMCRYIHDPNLFDNGFEIERYALIWRESHDEINGVVEALTRRVLDFAKFEPEHRYAYPFR